MSSSKRELTEEEARRLWERATELQAEAAPRGRLPDGDSDVPADTASPGYAVDVVRQAALDAGIDPEFVDKALVEVHTEAEGGRLDRWADRFLKDAPKWLTVRRTLDASPEDTYASLQRVFPNSPYGFNLIGTRGASPLEGGRLIFEVPNQVGVATSGNSTVFDIRQHAGILEIEVSLRAAGEDATQTELEITAQLVRGRRIAFVAAHLVGGLTSGLGALITFFVSLGFLGPEMMPLLVLAAAGGGGGFLVGTRAFRPLYRWALRRAERAFERLIGAIAVDVRTGGAFAPRGDRGALPPGTGFDEG
ncbi:MAG: hypothetical protein BMS9Abin29_2002 [Gemmatimonadota bacterium]|nr:MAG: hypothetical protein BMS9Abin29_2002 [Gemmatimonadota bacterium]